MTEISFRSVFEGWFNRKLDTIWHTGDITLLVAWDEAELGNIMKENSKLSKMKTTEKTHNRFEEQIKNSNTLENQKKLTTYAELSDLAYVDFVTVQDESNPSKSVQKISKVYIDPLSFPNFKMIAEGKRPDNPTEDEEIILSYLRDHKNDDSEQWIFKAGNNKIIAPDVIQLFRLASLWSKQGSEKEQYAGLDEKYQSTMIDVHSDIPQTSRFSNIEIMTDGNFHMVDAMEHLRTIKEEQASKTMDEVRKKWFEIVDYFPNEANKDSSFSGFGAICLRDKAGNMHFAIRWTDVLAWIIPDPRDVIAGSKITFGHVPENQTQDMIAFFERNLKNLSKIEKVNITGHSLGGALTQIASVMYNEYVDESYTFNSPWAKNLSINPEGKPEIIRQKFEKFRDFEYNRGDEWSVENRITNVRGTKWLSPIANLGKRIGNYEIKLKELESHSIATVVNYLKALDATSPELVKEYVGKKRLEEKPKTTEQ